MSWKEEVAKINSGNCPQRQDSTEDQLRDLRNIANKLGFYDAADAINNVFLKKD